MIVRTKSRTNYVFLLYYCFENFWTTKSKAIKHIAMVVYFQKKVGEMFLTFGHLRKGNQKLF